MVNLIQDLNGPPTRLDLALADRGLIHEQTRVPVALRLGDALNLVDHNRSPPPSPGPRGIQDQVSISVGSGCRAQIRLL
jgi:hypothetical protein